jgi:hypothetical protein
MYSYTTPKFSRNAPVYMQALALKPSPKSISTRNLTCSHGVIITSLILVLPLLVVLGHELLLQLRRRRAVVAELHAELSLSLRASSQQRTEPEHSVQRAISVDGEILSIGLGIDDDSVALVQQTNDGTLELGGRGDGRLHQGLQDLGSSLCEGLAESLGCGVLESHFTGIDSVRGTIVDDHGGTQYAVAKQGTLHSGLVETLLASIQELLRKVVTSNLSFELVFFEGLGRLHPSDNASEISGPTRLLLQGVVEVDALGERLTVSDLGLTSFDLHAVLTAHALDINVQVQFTHTGDNSLLRLGVDVDTERRILTRKSVHGFTEVGGILGMLWLDRQRNDRLRNEHGGLKYVSDLASSDKETVLTIVYPRPPSVKVSPDAQSTPNTAQISPAPTS